MPIINYLIESLTSNQEQKSLLNWFGSSKVIDKNDKPLRVYHGTKNIFTKFDGDRNKNNYLGTPNGCFFFTDNPEIASAYGSTSDMFGKTDFKQNSNIIPVYLYMIKPLVINAKGSNWDEIPFDNDYYSTNDIVRYAQKDGGYDGIIIKNVVDSSNTFLTKKPSTIYVTFNERNIKSAIGNRNFNPLSDDILESFLTADKIKDSSGKERYVEIFKNPSTSELREINKSGAKYIRMAMDGKDLLAWNGDILHETVQKYLQTSFWSRFAYEYPKSEVEMYTNERENTYWNKPTNKDIIIEKLERCVPNFNKIIDIVTGDVVWNKDEHDINNEDAKIISDDIISDSLFLKWLKNDDGGNRWKNVKKIFDSDVQNKWIVILKDLKTYKKEYE